MVKAVVTVRTSQGLHLGPANVIANAAEEYKSMIRFVKGGMEINAKSILGIVSGCFQSGTSLTCICDGPDEKEALKKMQDLLGSELKDVKVRKRKIEI